MFTKIAYILVGLGGVLTGVGGLIFAVSWDADSLGGSDFEDFFNAIHAAQFGELFIVGVIGVIFALDLQKLVLNDAEKRLMYLTVPFAVIGLYLGINYAYIVNWEPSTSTTYEFFLYDQVACISAGYFIFGLMCIARLLVAKEKISLGDNPAKATLYEFLLACFIAIGGFICAVGMLHIYLVPGYLNIIGLYNIFRLLGDD